MTYDEFMRDFDKFVKFKVKMQIEKYGSAHAAALATGVPESSISKMMNNKQRGLSRESLIRFLEEDVYNEDIKDIKQLEIEYLEARLKSLKEQ